MRRRLTVRNSLFRSRHCRVWLWRFLFLDAPSDGLAISRILSLALAHNHCRRRKKRGTAQANGFPRQTVDWRTAGFAESDGLDKVYQQGFQLGCPHFNAYGRLFLFRILTEPIGYLREQETDQWVEFRIRPISFIPCLHFLEVG